MYISKTFDGPLTPHPVETHYTNGPLPILSSYHNETFI